MQNSIPELVSEGWRFRITEVSNHKYITMYRKGKSRSVGPYNDKLWQTIVESGGKPKTRVKESVLSDLETVKKESRGYKIKVEKLEKSLNSLKESIPGQLKDARKKGFNEANRLIGEDFRRQVEKGAYKRYRQIDKAEQQKYLDVELIKAVEKVKVFISSLLNGQTKVLCESCRGNTVLENIPFRCLTPGCIKGNVFDLLHFLEPHITNLNIKSLISKSIPDISKKKIPSTNE